MSVLATLVWGAASWRGVATAVGVAMAALLLLSYRNVRLPTRFKWLAGGLKAVGIMVLLLCLLEPLWSSPRARPGANLLVVLADNSRSMTLHDRGASATRAEQLKAATTRPSAWLDRVGEDFELREHTFDTALHAGGLKSLMFDGDASNLAAALARVRQQYHGRPLAGVMLLTDGNATDAAAVDRLLDQPNPTDGKLPPIYPVLLGGDTPADDINLQRVDVSQTDFEDAPVTVAATFVAENYGGRTLVAQLVDAGGKMLEQQTLRVPADSAPLTARFKLRPTDSGVSFYRVRVAEEGKLAALDANDTHAAGEATLANNLRWLTVDRGHGPYRVLYVAGRPNWEFKFLQRSLESDDQIRLVGLIRVAKREPKFAYLGRGGDRTNPLFRGFDNKDPDQTEQYDQPVLVRIGTRDAEELRGGFPRTAEELNAYSAVVIDDLESEFFTRDQLQLLKEFVRQRGGSLLMLGGQESFHDGQYDRTPVGDVLPVYTSESPSFAAEGMTYRLSLTREGWLAPWVRLRPDESAERARVAAMPAFRTLNTTRGIKPGATVLATADVVGGAVDASGGTANAAAGGENDAAHSGTVPALVEQRFGKGRAAALLIGDLWRWTLRRPPDATDDLPKAWRQTVRWLVSDVPRRVDVNVDAAATAAGATAVSSDVDAASGARSIAVHVRDAAFAPQDNATVSLLVTPPDGPPVNLTAEADAAEAGLYRATFVPRISGVYRVRATAADAEGRPISTVEAGWTVDPAPDEFNDLRPNRALLARIATKTGGQTVAVADLDAFARTLPQRHAEVIDPDITPLWQRPWVFALAIGCLAAEWGVRRWKGLP